MSWIPPTPAPAHRRDDVVVLSPHFDDTVFGCWQVLTDPRVHATVVNVFAGRPPRGWRTPVDRDSGFADSAALVDERAAEDAVALAHVGLVPLNLPFVEFRYRVRQVRVAPWVARLTRRPGRRTWTLPWSRDEHDLPERLGDTCCELVDGRDRVVAPAAIGGHPDHVLAREAARVACARTGVPLRLYADLPYASSGGWPTWTASGGASDLVGDARIEAAWSASAG